MLAIQTLRPGLLVSLKSSVTGNAKYIPHDRQVRIDADGKEITEIETTRIIADPAEFKRAGEVRGKARSIISSVCSSSNFGLLCPERDRETLDKAIAEARKVVSEFNATATLTHVEVFAMIGHIASDDVEAVRAINSEISDLLGKMEAGLKNLDVKAIRKAANDAKEVGQMLTPEAATRVQMAIDTARSAARKIVKAGETAAAEVDLRAIRKISESRTAFLDLGDAKDVSAPRQEARQLDLTPEATVAKAKPKARALEL
jgi:hypothetical protein